MKPSFSAAVRDRLSDLSPMREQRNSDEGAADYHTKPVGSFFDQGIVQSETEKYQAEQREYQHRGSQFRLLPADAPHPFDAQLERVAISCQSGAALTACQHEAEVDDRTTTADAFAALAAHSDRGNSFMGETVHNVPRLALCDRTHGP